MRRSFQRRPSARRAKRDTVWVNIPFAAAAFTESIGTQILMVPEDWEAQFTGNAWERATLLAIKGNITVQQTVAGTAGTTGFWGIYIMDANASVNPAFTVAGMSEVDWLYTGALGISTSVTTSLTSAQGAVIPIDIKTKRRLNGRDAIWISAQYGSDAASPAGVMGGLLRFLVARN